MSVMRVIPGERARLEQFECPIGNGRCCAQQIRRDESFILARKSFDRLSMADDAAPSTALPESSVSKMWKASTSVGHCFERLPRLSFPRRGCDPRTAVRGRSCANNCG
jgi:hypothetical protein